MLVTPLAKYEDQIVVFELANITGCVRSMFISLYILENRVCKVFYLIRDIRSLKVDYREVSVPCLVGEV